MNTPTAKQTVFEQMTERFSQSELRDLTYALNIEWGQLEGETTSNKVNELLQFAARHEKLAALVGQLRKERPFLQWPNLNEDDFLPTELHPTSQTSNEVIATNGGKIVVGNAIHQKGNRNRLIAENEGQISASNLTQEEPTTS